MDIHFLLEQLPLQKITKGFVKKYPDVNIQLAHNALLLFNDFNKKEKINFLGKVNYLKEMESRLRAAVANASQILKPNQAKTLLLKKDKPQPE